MCGLHRIIKRVVDSPNALPVDAGSGFLAAGRAEAGANALQVRADLVVCEQCEAVYRRAVLQGDEDARCVRCQALVGRGHRVDIDAQFALTIAALLLFCIGNLFPIVTLELRGSRSQVTLYESVRATWVAGEQFVAVLAAATAFVFPLIVIGLRMYVLGALNAGWVPPGFAVAMQTLGFAIRWSMVEVFMLGTLIAVVRSAGLASVVPGAGIFAFAALTVLLTANLVAGMHRVWQRATELAQ